jgi:redox-sensing transcriptional repressor
MQYTGLRPPLPSLRRLPNYHHLLKEMQAAGLQFVSCNSIGKEMKLEPTQVRKDLEITGVTGKPKVGYVVTDVLWRIEAFLGWNNSKDAFLAGAGSLGSALLGYERFQQFGINIVAAFDTDPSKIAAQIHGKPVLPLEKLTEMTARMHVHIGIITVPGQAAQAVADLMIAGGIRAIWNFAPVHLRVPDQVILQSEDLYHSLASLSFKLAQRLETETHAQEI